MTIDYLNPNIPKYLRRVAMPVVDATDANLGGYGYLVSEPDNVRVEIVRWRSQGWRTVDPDSGDGGGTTEGVFLSEWKGQILFGHNEAVEGHYILAYANEPCLADVASDRPPEKMLLWHANYHPDGGQLKNKTPAMEIGLYHRPLSMLELLSLCGFHCLTS